MQKTDFVSGLFFLVFAGLICILSYRVQIGTLYQPGPGFLFFYCGLALGLMSLAMVLRSVNGRRTWKPLALPFRGTNLKKVIPIVLSVFLYVALLEQLGFFLSTFLELFFLLKIIEKKSWRISLVTCFSVTACCYLLFEFWLEAQLPRGFLSSIHY